MQLVRSATCLYRYPSRLSRVARYDVGPDLFCVRRQGGFARLPQVNEPTVRLSLDVSRASLAITKRITHASLLRTQSRRRTHYLGTS